MTGRGHRAAMQVPGLDLADGEYTITPSEALTEANDALSDLLAGGMQEEYHLYDIEAAADETVLEVCRREADETFVDVVAEEGFVAALGRVDVTFRFRSPDDETHMILKRGGVTPTHTLRDEPGAVLARWDRPFIIPWMGDWKLRGPGGESRATAERDGWLGRLGSSDPETYRVCAPDGTKVAEFDRSHPEGGLVALALSEMTVSLSNDAIPPEVAVAFALGLLTEAQRGSSGSGHASGS